MKRISLIFMMFILTTLTAFGSILSTPSKQVITVGVYDNPPAVSMENDHATGYFPKIFESISDSLNIEFKYVYGSWDVIYEGTKAGKIDMIYDIAKSKEREKYFDFCKETVMVSWGTIYAKPGLEINTLFDLEGKKIAVVDSDVYYEGQDDSLKTVLDTLGVKAEYLETGGFTESVELVENKMADVCIVNRVYAEYNLTDTRLVRTPIVFKPVHSTIAFSKGSSLSRQYLARFDEELSKLKSDKNSVYYKIMDSYTMNYAIVDKIPTWLWKIVVWPIIGVILSAILIHYLILREQVKRKTNELNEANIKLMALSATDALTKIANRRTFNERLHYEIDRTKRYHLKLSLIMIDIDFFKKVNDAYGHIVGDHVLLRIASIISDHMRTVDLVARYGGEEFAIILPETDLCETYLIAEKVMHLIEEHNFDDLANGLKITVTCGVSEWKPEYDTNIEKFIESADHAMYHGKSQGRNCVIEFDKMKKMVPVD